MNVMQSSIYNVKHCPNVSANFFSLILATLMMVFSMLVSVLCYINQLKCVSGFPLFCIFIIMTRLDMNFPCKPTTSMQSPCQPPWLIDVWNQVTIKPFAASKPEAHLLPISREIFLNVSSQYEIHPIFLFREYLWGMKVDFGKVFFNWNKELWAKKYLL